MSIEMSAPARAKTAADRTPEPRRAATKRKAVHVALGVLVYAVITALTLFVVDRLMIAMDLFPPTYDYGHADVGWVSAHATGRMVEERCVNIATRQIAAFPRNEDGMRTAHSVEALQRPSSTFKVAVSGDSHTELCEPTEKVHFGVMERELNLLGLPSAVFAFGAGKYSPLQAYLAVREFIQKYDADAFVLNLYTGNDFLDILRVDDRPHLEPNGDGYRIAEPVWYQFDRPGKTRESRVLFLAEQAYEKTGLRRIALRVEYLSDIAATQNAGVLAVGAYMNDLRKASSEKVEYRDAFTAQMLNQQLFFHHFAGSREESLRRIEAVLKLVRQENPDRMLVLSPIPSYQLVDRRPVDAAFLEVLDRLPVTYESGVAEELALYESLIGMARDNGWIFVDNLTELRRHESTESFYNRTDYHIEPVVSEIIGTAQARAIASICNSREAHSGAGPVPVHVRCD